MYLLVDEATPPIIYLRPAPTNWSLWRPIISIGRELVTVTFFTESIARGYCPRYICSWACLDTWGPLASCRGKLRTALAGLALSPGGWLLARLGINCLSCLACLAVRHVKIVNSLLSQMNDKSIVGIPKQAITRIFISQVRVIRGILAFWLNGECLAVWL